MAFATFVFFQAFNLLNVRHDTRSVFSRDTLRQPLRPSSPPAPSSRCSSCVVEIDAAARLLHHHRPDRGQWLTCAAVGSTILCAGELVKFVLRTRDRNRRRAADGVLS